MSTTDADLPAMPPKRRSFFCTKCHGHVCKSGTENAQHPQCATCGYLGFGEDCDYSDDEMHAYARAAIEVDRARAAGEAEKLRADAAALDWIECRAMNGQIQIARSIMGKGYEIATLERNGGPVIITVELGTLRKAIAARTGSTPTTKEQGS